MSISWIAPAALIGIALIALPIAVHLLVRRPVRQFPFPSLRFVRETQLAAFRRGALEDAWLLACRVGIVALAALALAGPVIRTDARMRTLAERVSRAIVVVESTTDDTLAHLRDGAFVAADFARSNVADALHDAARWLDRQPPSSREIVIAGRLRRGSVLDSDLAQVPRDIGIRFLPEAFDTPAETRVTILKRDAGRLVQRERLIVTTADATVITEGGSTAVPQDLVNIYAAAANTDLAAAALRAALEVGVPWTDFTTSVDVVWQGGGEGRAGARVIRMPVPQPAASAADAVSASLIANSPQPELKEPLPITPEQLESWSRRPGAISPDAPISDEGDRRWLWGAVLALLLVEWRLRASRRGVRAAEHGEVRVA